MRASQPVQLEFRFEHPLTLPPSHPVRQLYERSPFIRRLLDQRLRDPDEDED